MRYVGSDEGKTHLYKLHQTYMLTALNTKEVHSKQQCDKHNGTPKFKLGDVIMIKILTKSQHGMQNMFQTLE